MPELKRNLGEVQDEVSDVPDFDAYPAPPPNPMTPDFSIGNHTRPYLPRPKGQQLNAAAEKIGTAAGKAMGAVKDVQKKLQVVPDRMKDMTQQLGGQISEKSEALRRNVSETAGEWKSVAQAKGREARMRAQEFAREKPFHVLAAVAIAAFSAGVGLRIWRSYRG